MASEDKSHRGLLIDYVFVDDLGVNLSPAAKLGMATVHHRAAPDTIAQLERFLGVSLR